MFFNLFGKNKDEYMAAYAKKLSDAVLDDALDETVLEELIRYAKEKDLSRTMNYTSLSSRPAT